MLSYPLQHDEVVHVDRYMQISSHSLHMQPAIHQAALVGLERRIDRLHLLQVTRLSRAQLSVYGAQQLAV